MFGRLKVVEYVGKDRRGSSKWQCLCDCGKEKIISGPCLTRGDTKSCGCLNKDIHTKHGYKNTPTYNSWASMIGRCGNPKNPAYKNYGGRRITVCKRWLNKKNGFINFLNDMGERPKGKTLDRTDNNKLREGYSLENCRWSTPKEQANNRRIKLTRRPSLICNYERKLRNAVGRLRLKDNRRINFSKYLSYSSVDLYNHLNSIKKSQNNCCPMCNKPYNEIKFDIDHIIPTSSAKTKEGLLKLFNLDNLSPLCYICNRYVKRNKIATIEINNV